MGYSNFMRALKVQYVFICKTEQRILQNRINILRNQTSEAILHIDGERGFLGHLIKCIEWKQVIGILMWIVETHVCLFVFIPEAPVPVS